MPSRRPHGWLWIALLLFVAHADAAGRAEAGEPRQSSASSEEGEGPESVAEAQIAPPPSPRLVIRGFGDVNYGTRGSSGPEASSHGGFALGELDLFMTSQIARDLRVLSELVFHFEDDREEEFVEVERLLLQYQPSDAFGVRVGRLHTSIGHWSHSFHHGAWFQTTIDRPEIFAFEDEGGILPIHSVGLESFGLKTFGELDVQYVGGIFNGRGPTTRVIQAASDGNGSKALLGQLELLPTRIHGLRLGFSLYSDVFPADESRSARQGEMDERILTAHVVYESAGLELLAEGVWQRHEEPQSGRRFDTSGAYGQLAYRIGNWKPYARGETLDVDESDPIFDLGQRDLDRALLGVRWDPSPWLAIKLEVRSIRERKLSWSSEAIAQAAFTF